MDIQKKSPVTDALLAAARMMMACFATVIVMFAVFTACSITMGEASAHGTMWVSLAIVSAALYLLLKRRHPFADRAFSPSRLAPYLLSAGVAAAGYMARFAIYMTAGGEMTTPLSFSGFAYAAATALFGAMVHDALCVRFLLRRGHAAKTVVIIMAAIQLAMDLFLLLSDRFGAASVFIGRTAEMLIAILHIVFTTMLFIKSGGFAGRMLVTTVSILFAVAAPTYHAMHIVADAVLIAALAAAVFVLDKAPLQPDKTA